MLKLIWVYLAEQQGTILSSLTLNFPYLANLDSTSFMMAGAFLSSKTLSEPKNTVLAAIFITDTLSTISFSAYSAKILFVLSTRVLNKEFKSNKEEIIIIIGQQELKFPMEVNDDN